MRGRANLAKLMGLVAALGVGLAVMKVATEPSARVVFGSGLLALLVATLVALVRQDGRARWIGFALFGWVYALVLLVPPLRESVATELPGSRMLGEALGEIVDLLQPPVSEPYARAGIPAYWVFNLRQDVIYVYTDPIPADKRYGSMTTIDRDGSILFVLDGTQVAMIAASTVL